MSTLKPFIVVCLIASALALGAEQSFARGAARGETVQATMIFGGAGDGFFWAGEKKFFVTEKTKITTRRGTPISLKSISPNVKVKITYRLGEGDGPVADTVQAME